MDKPQQYTVNGKVFKVGDNTQMGKISEFFKAGGQMCFFTESGAQYPARYLWDCHVVKREQ